MFREGLKAIIGCDARFEVIGECGKGDVLQNISL
jgi:hypothetical protein